MTNVSLLSLHLMLLCDQPSLWACKLSSLMFLNQIRLSFFVIFNVEVGMTACMIVDVTAGMIVGMSAGMIVGMTAAFFFWDDCLHGAGYHYSNA